MCVVFVLAYSMCMQNSQVGLRTNISSVNMAHCPYYKQPSRVTCNLKSQRRENSSMIMILLHARQLLRAVLSTGSQHFSGCSSTQITYKEAEVKV